MEPVAAARALVEERFPECLAAFVAGSVIEGRGTRSSDLDMVIITVEEEAPYRESLIYEGWPVELFVHTTESYLHYFESDAKSRMPALPTMCLGTILVDRDGTAAKARSDAETLLLKGPEAPTEDELASMRYALTDLLDDFLDVTDRQQAAFVAQALSEGSATLILTVRGKWSGKAKWLAKALDAGCPGLSERLVGCLRSFWREGDKEPLASFAQMALNEAGGRLWEGYRQGGKRK